MYSREQELDHTSRTATTVRCTPSCNALSPTTLETLAADGVAVIEDSGTEPHAVLLAEDEATPYLEARRDPSRDEYRAPILVLVQHWDPERARSLLSQGASEVLAGDLQPQLLAARIHRWASYARQYMEQVDAYRRRIRLLATGFHDLRGPFGSLRSVGSMLRDFTNRGHTEGIHELADALDASTEQSYRLLERLEHWSHISSDLALPPPEPVNLAETVGTVTEMFRTSIYNKALQLEREIPPETMVRAAPYQLRAVLRNLLSNAIKFSRRGGQIRIASYPRDTELELRVEDTGIGMSETMRAQLFDWNRRPRSEGTDGEEGSGLGLVFVRELLEKMGGSIRVDSEPEHGTTVTLRLPRAPVPQESGEAYGSRAN
jgi:signal transduction histidine kinase